MVHSGRGRNGSGRFNLNRGNRDPFWRKDESGSNGQQGPAEPRLESPDDIADWIAHRAYELYEARGKTDGDDQADWFQAEREAADLQNRDPSDGEPPASEEGSAGE